MMEAADDDMCCADFMTSGVLNLLDACAVTPESTNLVFTYDNNECNVMSTLTLTYRLKS